MMTNFITDSEKTDQTVESKDVNQDASKNYKVEDKNEFAAGLPAWDLLPPQVVIRRVKRSI